MGTVKKRGFWLIFDAHMHLVHSSLPDFSKTGKSVDFYAGVACALSEDEFIKQEKIIDSIPQNSGISFFKSFGIHPQNPDFSYSEYLIQLLENKKIDAVGECGFDFFTQDFRSMSQKQEKVWNFQLEAAIKYGKPLVIHGRKCTERLFKDIKLLKKVKGVVFHSWAGTLTEANSLLKKGVNAYFSFGKPILNGKKSAVECVKFLEESRIVFETDAPYQTLKGEEKTLPEDSLKVYEQAEKLRGKKIEPDITSLFKN